jgi:hypothetical protein
MRLTMEIDRAYDIEYNTPPQRDAIKEMKHIRCVKQMKDMKRKIEMNLKVLSEKIYYQSEK